MRPSRPAAATALVVIALALFAPPTTADMANGWLTTSALGTMLESVKPAPPKPPPTPAPVSLDAATVAALAAALAANGVAAGPPPVANAAGLNPAAVGAGAGVSSGGGNTPSTVSAVLPGFIAPSPGAPYGIAAVAEIPASVLESRSVAGVGAVAPAQSAARGPPAAAKPAAKPAAAAPPKLVSYSTDPWTGEVVGGADPRGDDMVAGPAAPLADDPGRVGGGAGFPGSVFPGGFATPRILALGPDGAPLPADAPAAAHPAGYLLTAPVTPVAGGGGGGGGGATVAPPRPPEGWVTTPTPLPTPPPTPSPSASAMAAAANATTAEERCVSILAALRSGACGGGTAAAQRDAASLATAACPALADASNSLALPTTACCPLLRDFATSGCGCVATLRDRIAATGAPAAFPAALTRVAQAVCGVGSVYDPCSQSTGC